MNTIYCDSAATTPIYIDVAKKMNDLMIDSFGNPSSIHRIGQKSKAVIERSRLSIANLLMCDVSEIIFTSGGSESNNIALLGILNSGDHFITSSYEHPAVEAIAKSLVRKGVEVSYVRPNSNGIIEAGKIDEQIKSNTKLISIMYVNNELGTTNPIDEISLISKNNNILFHTDAVQVIGKKLISLENNNIDMLSLSAHKFYGPKGVGCLYIKNGVDLVSTYFGGGQEMNLRPGTENIAGIYGMSLSLEKSIQEIPSFTKKMIRLESIFLNQLQKLNTNFIINGGDRIPGFLNITFNGINSQDLVIGLDMKGFAISGGSACSSGAIAPSKILKEIGLSDEAASQSVRISFGKNLSDNNVEELANQISYIINDK